MGFGRMDALEALEAELSDSEADEEGKDEEAAVEAAPQKKTQIDFETLQKAGYKGCDITIFSQVLRGIAKHA